MRFPKGSLGIVMTCKTKGRFGLDQQICLVRTMRGMTGHATFCRLHGLMNNLLLIIPFLVALEAGFIALFIQ